ncbi:MAG: hypothetical protein ABW118_16985 [Candidatus Thiodiazotropha sp.]
MSDTVPQKPIISDKPYSVPIEMRPLWRICLIIISIITVAGDKGYLSVKKVNMLVWMLIRQKRWHEYEDFLLGRTLDIPLVSADTATYKAVEFALAKNFISLENGRLSICESSLDIYHILVDNDIMTNEIIFLNNVGKKLTESKVKTITEGLL